jgi:FixJ family two-component response regulator
MIFPIYIAVVDDDRSVRTALHRLLTAAGFRTDVFASGGEFLASMHGRKPDSLIIDVNMPGMTGLDLLRRVLERIPDLPVILISAADNVPDIGLGSAACLQKPIGEEELFAAIGAALKLECSALDRLTCPLQLDQGPIETSRRLDT